MAKWSDAQICTLIDERRTRNDEFHNLRRNQKIFWNSIANKINQENGTSFNGYQCKEKFSNLVWNYNAMSSVWVWARTSPISAKALQKKNKEEKRGIGQMGQMGQMF
ncbi:hypothetical protein C1646_772673 [Rhizophagus diaphanus]|nr:hypothetical protein C1646_772673 [Rhizophagus diaphanus] [Rhizophagus sp. MUCL 43196]